MALIHLATYRTSGQVRLEGQWLYAVFAGVLVLVHALRIRIRAALADRWLRLRGLPLDQDGRQEIRSYLRRLRFARLAGAVAFMGLALTSAALFSIPIGVASAPYLVSVLIAEISTPDRTRGTTRLASLGRRSSDFFAPRRAVAVVRALFATGTVLAVVAAGLGHPRAAIPHALLLAACAGLFELALRAIAERGLPTSPPELQRDTAIRVASSRTATAAALACAVLGTTYSLALAVHDTAAGWWGRPLLNQLMTLGIASGAGAVIWLSRPVPSWHPRTR